MNNKRSDTYNKSSSDCLFLVEFNSNCTKPNKRGFQTNFKKNVLYCHCSFILDTSLPNRLIRCIMNGLPSQET